MTYEITQAISLGNQITDSFCSAMIDNYGSGDKLSLDQQTIDCCLVRSLVKTLEFYNLNGADTELTTTQILSVIDKIHEYDYALLLDVQDFAIQVGSDADALGGVNSVIVINGNGSSIVTPTAHSYTFTVSTNGQTVFTMPFDVSQVDTDSIYLTLNDATNPEYGTDYSMSGTTMTWSGSYPLSAGWRFEIKYWI